LRGGEADKAIQFLILKVFLDCFVAALRAMTVNNMLELWVEWLLMREPAVYIMASARNGTLYTGVTSNLIQRVWQHKNGICDGFTLKYNCKMLVYYESWDDMRSAIDREKQLKGGSRKQKLILIESANPDWSDIYEDLI
jgi:putative endonuclease